MRKLSLIISICILAGIVGVYLWFRRAPAFPSASIQLVGYDTNKDSIVATIILTNTGTSALSYEASGGAFCRVSARVQGIETNFYSGAAHVSMSWQVVVWPSRSSRTHVFLPLGTETWRCTIPVRGTSSRIRAFTHLQESKLPSPLKKISYWCVPLFPLNDSDEREVQSENYQISTNQLR